MPWWPIFFLLFWIPARCLMVLAAAVVFSIQLRTTSLLLLLLHRIHTYISVELLWWKLLCLFRSYRREGEER